VKTGISFVLSALIFWIGGITGVQSAETFRGIPWGTDKKELANLVEGPKQGEVEVFTRAEQKKVGDITVGNIYYLFYKGKFGAAKIFFQGASNFSDLKDTLSQKYGSSKTADPLREEYTWDFEDLTIFFEYSTAKNEGCINYFFKPIVQQREEDLVKAKKKALEDL
jgi:hypothetical protein